MDIDIHKLKEHKLNLLLFYEDKTSIDFKALKHDIKENGIKTELHITDNHVILCGHKRFKAAKELGMKSVPCKIIPGLGTIEKQEEYIIKDNLLRRHLSTEQRYLLFARLSELNEIGRGRKIGSKVIDGKVEEATVASFIPNVWEKTAEETGVSPRTIGKARAYYKAIKENPELKGKPVSEVLTIKKDRQQPPHPKEDEKEDDVIKIEQIVRELDQIADYLKELSYNPKYHKEAIQSIYLHAKQMLRE